MEVHPILAHPGAVMDLRAEAAATGPHEAVAVPEAVLMAVSEAATSTVADMETTGMSIFFSLPIFMKGRRN